jgi:lysozyme family protein
VTDQFSFSLANVLQSEGGFSNDPKDPGGATNKGITQAVYDSYRSCNTQPLQSVRFISDAEVRAIYRANYWDAAKCDQLPAGVSYIVFDGSVNSGVSQSSKWLQRALGVDDDGQIGPKTLSAAAAVADKRKLIDAICDERLKFLQALPTWSHFGNGWKSRVASVRATGKAAA